MYNLKFSHKKISAAALALITLVSCILLVGSPVNAQTQMPSGTVTNWQDKVLDYFHQVSPPMSLSNLPRT